MRIMSKVGRGRSGSCPTGPHCTMGHGTGRAQGALITRSVRPTGREREREQRAVMMMDDGAAGCLQWTGLKGRSAACGWNYLGTERVGSGANFVAGV